MSNIRFSTFPRTSPPPVWASTLVDVFLQHESAIDTMKLAKGLTSDEVLSELRDDLVSIGFEVEAGKAKTDKILRPVFFGENAFPTLQYEIDAYHTDWECGLEVEAGRAWMGNAVYRDLIQACVMVQVKHLALAVPNTYKYNTSGRTTVSTDYKNTSEVAEALYGHTRLQMPYGLVLIGN